METGISWSRSGSARSLAPKLVSLPTSRAGPTLRGRRSARRNLGGSSSTCDGRAGVPASLSGCLRPALQGQTSSTTTTAWWSAVSVAVYTPDNEPYLGVPGVMALDRMIPLLVTEQHRAAHLTRQSSLSDLQRAAAEIVPAACSIALSIRELVRQAYLISALVLQRPLFDE